MKNENKVRILAFAGVLIAMNIVLARLVAINIGPTLRITVSQTPIFLAGSLIMRRRRTESEWLSMTLM